MESIMRSLGLIFLILNGGKSALSKDLELKKVDIPKNISLVDALKKRSSHRSFLAKELTDQELSNLLWVANGINRGDSKHTAPMLWNMNIYVAMKKGTYLYNPKKHKLQEVSKKDIRGGLAHQSFVSSAPVVLIYTLNYNQLTDSWVSSTSGKEFYGGNQAGHVSQNVYLYAAASNMATVAMSWTKEDGIKESLSLKKEERVLLIQPVGYK